MADRLCLGDTVGDVIDKIIDTDYSVMTCSPKNSAGVLCAQVNPFYLDSAPSPSDREELFGQMCRGGRKAPGFSSEDDCRKKRCVERYDSSESSDSGVAVLSCTDCSGSSTASSDITDPGSPFSTTSNHSEDSASQPATRMPPTQTAHHPPWPWTAEELTSPINKRTMHEKTVFPKRLKSNEDTTTTTTKQSPPCLNKLSATKPSSDPSPNDNKFINVKKIKKSEQSIKQGKITEYFKSQIKLHVLHSKESKPPCNNSNKLVSLVDQQTQFNGIRPMSARATKKILEAKRKIATVPRKILPAPSKLPLSGLTNFAPTVTLTTVSFPPNLAYLHTKAPKPPDSIFMPQFITQDKLLMNRTPCLNVIHQPVQKLLNNFNCVKLNATVVPIVKLNALPSRLNGAALSVETAAPTVMSASTMPLEIDGAAKTDSDSGVSVKDSLEVAVEEAVAAQPPLKSPILSQPKTIRFPAAKQRLKEDAKASNAQDLGLCKWEKCTAQFDTSGALLEHLQVKHVISQASQEQYVCLWIGCKVHGRTSCSRSWLERHVLAHAGTKPFRCIVDGCGQRFNSQLTLERHVNGHFNGDGSNSSSTKKTTETSSTKLFKRNGKKIRFRRQPWSARMFDFIDSGIMEGLQHKLLTLTEDRTLGQISNAGNTVNVLSQVIARRVEPDGRAKFLVRWHPTNVIPDEWVWEKEFVSTKLVKIPSLEPSAKAALDTHLFPSEARSEKRRRKPISKQQT